MRRLALFTIVALIAPMTPAWADEELDVEVGVDDAGRLAFPTFDFGKVLLEPVDPGNPFGLAGWSGDDPGWAAEGAPEGLNALGAGANIRVELLSISPALRMLDPNAGLADVPVGGFWDLGGPEFDGHPIWLIDSDSPTFDPEQDNWIATFRLVDTGTTGYFPSIEHSFRFGIVPEPASLGLLLIGLAVAARR